MSQTIPFEIFMSLRVGGVISADKVHQSGRNSALGRSLYHTMMKTKDKYGARPHKGK